MGIGAIPLWTTGFAHVEQQSWKKNAPLSFGLINGASATGAMIGLFVTSICLSIWTEVGSDPPEDISGTDDPNWVGAWWIMFTVGFGLTVVCSLPMFGFPKQLPGVAEIRYEEAEDKTEANAEDKKNVMEKEGEDIEESADNFFRNLIQIWKNPIFVTILFAEIGETILGTGTAAFGIKFLQEVFWLSPIAAGIFSGFYQLFYLHYIIVKSQNVHIISK